MRSHCQMLAAALAGLSCLLHYSPALSQEEAEAEGGAEAAPPRLQAPPMSPDAALTRAISFYDQSRYSECVDAFGELLAPGRQRPLTDPRQREQARIYYAACLIAEGKQEQADQQFRAAIRDNPQIGIPSAVIFPQPVIDRFILIRSTMLEEIRKAQEKQAREAEEQAEAARRRELAEERRMKELERLAEQESIIVKNQRWIATVPFGVGQFQNRDYVLGAIFLGSEVALVGTALTAVLIQLSLHSQANGGRFNDPDASAVAELNQNLENAQVVSLAATGGFLVTAIAGVVEAHLSFVPEFREGVRKRKSSRGKKPPAAGLRLTPTAAPRAGGAQIGVVGSF